MNDVTQTAGLRRGRSDSNLELQLKTPQTNSLRYKKLKE